MRVGCEVRCELWDGPVPLAVRDLSPEGMWVETDLPLDVGEELLATFSPPGSCVRMHALCEVSHVTLWRRTVDVLPSGMGLTFTDLTPRDRARLSRSLVGLPPPLPLSVRARGLHRPAPAPCPTPAGLPPVLDPAL